MHVRNLLWAVAAAALLAVAAPAQKKVEANFDSDPVNRLPPGWISAMTHKGGAPRWEVVRDETAPSRPNVLAQLSNDRTHGRFPLAIYQKLELKDGDLSVKFKPISGKIDASGGLVWRYKDPNNYYIVRSNALEDNTVLYKVENGRRSSIAPKGTPPRTYGVNHKVTLGDWHTLRVTFQGPLFTVYYDGKKMFEVEDHTFSEAGKVGLWTKADSVTHFDDFRATGR